MASIFKDKGEFRDFSFTPLGADAWDGLTFILNLNAG
jgi:hypothetical protein